MINNDRLLPLPAPALRRLIEGMPKTELHLHLDGSLRVDTALELARQRGFDLPHTYVGMFAALVAPKKHGSQAGLLKAFDLPVLLMQDGEALERVTRELVISKAGDNVRYLEIRWAPALHTRKGLSLDEVIKAVCEGAKNGAQLTGTTIRLIAVAVRSHEPSLNVTVAETTSKYRDSGMVGFDLAGLEEKFPDPLLHKKAFEAARAGGLRLTVHAGEIPGQSIWLRQALELNPERIAHGVNATQDNKLIQELISRRVTLDLCPTSNLQAGSVESLREHPIANFLRRGILVTLNTDDPTISDVTLSEEYYRTVRIIGMTLPELWQTNLNGLKAAFADLDTLKPIFEEFNAWANNIPELH